MKQIYRWLYERVQQGTWVFLITRLRDDKIEKYIYNDKKDEEGLAKQVNPLECTLIEEVQKQGSPRILQCEDGMLIAEPFSQRERMLLLGGGHVSLALAEFGAKIGFAVTVADDRPYFANKARFPWASEVICDSFQNVIEKLHVTSADYVVILTRGHRYDGECLRSLYEQPDTAYLGMIGSRRRVKSLKEQLAEEGIKEEWLKRLHAPVGLDIGAVTPEEIAVAILAEVIQVKRRPVRGAYQVLQSDVDMRVMEELAYPPDKRQGMKKAIVTILETRGSVPRKAGAKMLIYENGFTAGTIGGGCVEADMIGRAREVIGTGGFQICEIDMTGTLAEEEGMVCGGVMKILIEDDISCCFL